MSGDAGLRPGLLWGLESAACINARRTLDWGASASLGWGRCRAMDLVEDLLEGLRVTPQGIRDVGVPQYDRLERVSTEETSGLAPAVEREPDGR